MTYTRLEAPAGSKGTGLPGAAIIFLHIDEQGQDGIDHLLRDRCRYFLTRVAYAESAEFDLVGGFDQMMRTLPPPAAYDVVAFACTSGPISMGLECFMSRLRNSAPGKLLTVPAIAALRALQTVGSKRIALLTPYPRALHDQVAAAFETGGQAVVHSASFEISDDALIGRVTTEQLIRAGRLLVRGKDVDVLFISCCALAVSRVMRQLANGIGAPVAASVPALAWDVLRLLNVASDLPAVYLPR
jgi:maleate isomerase